MTQVIRILENVRATTPLVHCMTNSVVPEITANVLLAIGAAPAMIDLPEDARVFAGLASALLINVGNGLGEQHQGMRLAVDAAESAHTPWVLDPVAVGGLPVRTALAREVLQHHPAAVRANASEILGLTGESAGGRGVDATDEVEAALGAARSLTQSSGAVVAISGPTDVVISPDRTTRITGGSPLMPLVVGTGCSLGAVVAACIAAARSAQLPDHDGVVAAHALFAAAGTLADRQANAPASFRTAWIDALYTVKPDEVVQLAAIEES
jgi:hydroxyethylthiazole kinase